MCETTSVLAYEHGGQGFPVFANGCMIVLQAHEVEVLRLSAKGLSETEIASTASLTGAQVTKTLHKIVSHLGASTHADLAAIAASHGLA